MIKRMYECIMYERIRKRCEQRRYAKELIKKTVFSACHGQSKEKSSTVMIALVVCISHDVFRHGDESSCPCRLKSGTHPG